jgi:hypothetical protein
MANPEHIEVIKKGTAVWNQWRQEHREIEPDSADADLSTINLKLAV